jgi:hypothetical protein
MEVNSGGGLNMEATFGVEFQYGGEFRGGLNMEATFGGVCFFMRILKLCRCCF